MNSLQSSTSQKHSIRVVPFKHLVERNNSGKLTVERGCKSLDATSRVVKNGGLNGVGQVPKTRARRSTRGRGASTSSGASSNGTGGEVHHKRTEKRPSRVSEAQWETLLEFLEKHPNLVKTRAYNNSAKGRRESARHWQAIADALNAEPQGTTKSPRDWSIYVSNYKSKLKKMVADINIDASSGLSSIDSRFLAIMRSGLGQATLTEMGNPSPDDSQPQRMSVSPVCPDMEGPTKPQATEKRPSRVSEAQWEMLLEFLEKHPNLVKARAYNNSAKGRRESARQWQAIADALNAEPQGATKIPRDWSIYVSNYKSKLKKMVADINTDASELSSIDTRLLAIMRSGLSQTTPTVKESQPARSSVSPASPALDGSPEPQEQKEVSQERSRSRSPVIHFEDPEVVEEKEGSREEVDPLAAGGRGTGHGQYHSPPLSGIERALCLLSRAEERRAAADAERARALRRVGDSLRRLAGVAERWLAGARRDS